MYVEKNKNGKTMGLELFSIWMRYHSTFYAVSQTKVQIIGVLSISLYTLIVTTIIVILVRKLIGLRVSEQEERTDGLDFGSHGESSYHL